MAVISKPIIAAQYAADSETTEYTVPNGTRTIVDKFTGYNGSGASVMLTVKLLPSGASAGAEYVIEARAIQAGDSWGFPHIVGHALEPGGGISVVAATASAVTIRASGREVT